MKPNPAAGTVNGVRETIFFPSAREPRWLLQKSCVEDFWRVLPVNGLRGIVKRAFARHFLPRLLFLTKSSQHDLGGAHFVYLGVDDGKRTSVAITLQAGQVLIEKTSQQSEAVNGLATEARVLGALMSETESTFPRFISFEKGILKYQGALPRLGFNPRRRADRVALIHALASLYSKFPIYRDSDGCVMCLAHGDLNKWNMFIDVNGRLHVFDFETAHHAPLGVDFLTAYEDELSGRDLRSALHEDVTALAYLLSFENLDVDVQVRRVIGRA